MFKKIHNKIVQLYYGTKDLYSKSGKIACIKAIFRYLCTGSIIPMRAKCDYNISKKKRFNEENNSFSKDVLFSIIVPVYNTPKKFIIEMINSVINQTYKNWELCLADGSDATHSYIGDICAKFSKTDTRIKYKKLEENLGISENTNACIKMSTGDYIALFDHDDLLHPSALFEVMKAICDENADFIYTDENTFSKTPYKAYCPNFKPDFSIDTLRSINYICHLSVFSRKLLDDVGLFRKICDGSQDYDMVLRLTEKARHIVHIPKVLYYWRAHSNSVAAGISAKPYVLDAAKIALSDHLKRCGIEGTVEDSTVPSSYKINYKIIGNPKVSIIIPNKDHINDLEKCLLSIFNKTTYENYEIIIIENNSVYKKTDVYYKSLESNDKINIITYNGDFNYSAINNFGAKHATGEYLILLNNDIEIITHSWIEEMLMFAQRDDMGAVGAKLYYPDGTIQHAGVVLGIMGLAGHSHKHSPASATGYMSRLSIAQNLSCVTAACIMIPLRVFNKVGGLDEKFAVAFNDVDFCMKVRSAGYLIVFTPYCEAYHYESKSRGYEDTHDKQKRFNSEIKRFHKKWRRELDGGDPYYNPNLTLDREDFTIKM